MESIGFRLDDGTIVEEVYDPRTGEAAFAVRYADGALAVGKNSFPIGDRVVVPCRDSMVTSGAVTLPGDVGEVGSRARLFDDVRSFLTTYVDFPPRYDYVVATYVVLTWLFDAFAAVPYLHIRGDADSGKSRALLAIGGLSYHAIPSTSSVTIAALYRALDAYKGTLVLDEADFARSRAWTEIVKVLNAGYQRGLRILRTGPGGRNMTVRAYDVYGPKVIATRRPFEDDALVSRCLVIPLKTTRRRDIPLTVPDGFHDEALGLRNRLLAFRLRCLPDLRPEPAYLRNGEEPRISQILSPLRQMAPDPEALEAVGASVRDAVFMARGATPGGEVVQAIFRLRTDETVPTLTAGDIAAEVNNQRPGQPMSARQVADVLRRDLGLGRWLFRVAGRNVSALRWDDEEMDHLARRFGIRQGDLATTSTTSTGGAMQEASTVDVVDVPPPSRGSA